MNERRGDKMSHRISRSFEEPTRSKDLSWNERWEGHDRGLITCWEVGREMRQKEPELAERAMRGELPPMGWKGGVVPPTKEETKEATKKKKKKYGTLSYLAQWQGIRGEDLEIDLSQEIELTCAKTGQKVIFTADFNKYKNA
jgi:hypothetical protein